MSRAITLRVINNLTLDDAAELSGVSVAGLCKALNQPHNQVAIDAMMVAYIKRVEARKAVLSAKAMERGEQLMDNAESEQVQARMVEFWAGKYQEKPVHKVQLSAHVQHGFAGYQYLKEGQQLVDITPEPDNVSGDPDGNSEQ